MVMTLQKIRVDLVQRFDRWFASLKKACALLICLSLLVACNNFSQSSQFSTALDQYAVGNYEEAVQNLISYINSYPKNSDKDQALFLLASIYHLRIKNSALAIRYYRTLIREHKNSKYFLPALFYLGQLYYYSDELEQKKAVSVFESYLRQAEKEKVQDDNLFFAKLYLADLYLRNRDEARARQEYKQIIQNTDDLEIQSFSYFKIGKSFEQEGNLNLAILTYQEAVKKYPADLAFSAMLALAGVYEKTFQWEKAMRIYADLEKKNAQPPAEKNKK